jgi:hypothetical protein
MHKYLPSKKFTFTLISIIVALGIIYFFSWLGNNKTETTSLTKAETQTKVQEFMALDTDGDGMKDWEEALWKTDPKKTDTDGDGTSDNEEIILNRDPLKQNINPANQEPSDKIDEKIITDNKKVADDFAKLSETDKMGRMLFSQYLATKKADQALTESDIAGIIQNTIAEMPDVSFKQYTLKNILISQGTSQEEIKKYANDLAEVILVGLFNDGFAKQDYDFYGIAEIENLMLIMEETSDTMDTRQAFNDLEPIINKYDLLVKNLLIVSVPKDLANDHLNFVNAFELIHDNLLQIRMSENNIVVLPQLLVSYPNNISNFWDVIEATGNIFVRNKIVFSSTDLGGQFFSGIIEKK